jgi:hypothetical protein
MVNGTIMHEQGNQLPKFFLTVFMLEINDYFSSVYFACLQFQELGLLPMTPVGISILDAYAGGVGVLESVSNAEFKAASKC